MAATSAALTLAGGVAGCASFRPRPSGRVLVVGGGVAGATAAGKLKRWGGPGVDVTLIERRPDYPSSPLSNLVVTGERSIDQLTWRYDGLSRLGVRVMQDEVTEFDPTSRRASFKTMPAASFDRVVLATGTEPVLDRLNGLSQAISPRPGAGRGSGSSPSPSGVVSPLLAEWQAADSVQRVRQRLESLRDGALVLLTIPRGPVGGSCAPYERACQIANYLRTRSRRSKLLVLDANPTILAAPRLFASLFVERYAGLLDYQPNMVLTDVDPGGRFVRTESGERIAADLINLIPPMRAGQLLRQAGLVDVDDRWCGVDWATMESNRFAGVHLVGDVVATAPGMPKSAGMAHAQGRLAAAAILDALGAGAGSRFEEGEGRPLDRTVLSADQFAMIDSNRAIRVTSTLRYAPDKKVFVLGGESSGDSAEAVGADLASQAVSWTSALRKDAFDA